MSDNSSIAPTAFPTWLAPDPATQRTELARIKRSNELTTFENAYETLLDHVRNGNPLSAAVERDPRELDYPRLLAWIHRDPDRKQRYLEAQELGAEVVADQMLEIADAADTIEDVQRSTLRINTRKWLLGVWNRKRYGETRQQETTVNININDAMAAAQARVDGMRTIDVSAKEIR